jgi:hypothetical protein
LYKRWPATIAIPSNSERPSGNANVSAPVDLIRSVVGVIYLLASALDRFLQPYVWLRPSGHNLSDMTGIVDWALSENHTVLQLVLHSSELMPGGSPYFHEKDDIVR